MNPDHLHLEVWLARGFLRPQDAGLSGSDHSVNINPYLLYTANITSFHILQRYFPNDINANSPVVDPLGINDGELNQWSLGGMDFYFGDDSQFYSEQEPFTPGVEWPVGTYPLRIYPFTIDDLVGFASYQYSWQPYALVNCPPSLETVPTRVPSEMMVASCTMPDLQMNELVP